MISWTLRPATQADVPFIMATWLKSARRQGDRALMTNTVYYQNEKRRIAELLEHARVTVLCNPADHDHIFGWICHQQPIPDVFIVHYAYVKRSYQRQGLAREALMQLWPAFGREQIGITDISPVVAEKRQKYQLHFNPSLLKGSL